MKRKKYSVDFLAAELEKAGDTLLKSLLELKLSRRLLHVLKKEHGSFTLESTIVFPVLISLILLFIIFGMYMYQKVVLYYAASATAERAAFGWDNSNRDPRNAMLAEAKYDGLYWRIGEDKMLSSLFGLGDTAADAAVALPFEQASGKSASDLSHRKLEQAANWIGQAGLAYEGQISYSRSVLKRTIEVKLKQPLSLQPLGQSWLKREPKTVSSASIVEPAEFIRSVDLVRYYTTKFTNNGGATGQSKTQAGKVLAPYKGSAEAGTAASADTTKP